MALVDCRECGGSISDQAATCPKCGIDYPSSKHVDVTFCREARFMGCLAELNVAVDDVNVGQLSNGSSFSISLPTGVHNIQIWAKLWGVVRTNTNIPIMGNQRVLVAVEYGPTIKVWW